MELFGLCHFRSIREQDENRVALVLLISYTKRGEPPAQSYPGGREIIRRPFNCYFLSTGGPVVQQELSEPIEESEGIPIFGPFTGAVPSLCGRFGCKCLLRLGELLSVVRVDSGPTLLSRRRLHGHLPILPRCSPWPDPILADVPLPAGGT
jgi:hypothetical protein